MSFIPSPSFTPSFWINLLSHINPKRNRALCFLLSFNSKVLNTYDAPHKALGRPQKPSKTPCLQEVCSPHNNNMLVTKITRFPLPNLCSLPLTENACWVVLHVNSECHPGTDQQNLDLQMHWLLHFQIFFPHIQKSAQVSYLNITDLGFLSSVFSHLSCLITNLALTLL